MVDNTRKWQDSISEREREKLLLPSLTEEKKYRGQVRYTNAITWGCQVP